VTSKNQSKMFINPTFNLGEIVYLITDADNNKRVITSIVVTGDEGLHYEVSSASMITRHYACELSLSPNI